MSSNVVTSGCIYLCFLFFVFLPVFKDLEALDSPSLDITLLEPGPVREQV